MDASDFLKIGDQVVVNFHSQAMTLIHQGTIKHIPMATGDSWLIEDDKGLHAISEPCTITRLKYEA
jgi:hypothetical protein